MSKTNYVLELEKPLISLMKQIEELERSSVAGNYDDAIARLKNEFYQLKNRIYANLDAHQKLQIARHPQRPYTLDFVKYLGQNWIELHGDRAGHDDGAIVGGLLELEANLTVLVVGNNKGRDIKEKQKCNFGMPQPTGYAKALRLFRHANNFGFPIITLIDTPGAYPGLEAEALGQSRAIAHNIQEMFNLEVPIISVITGEGGSGGALALAVANKVLMFEHSVYSVISPEGCAAILWRTREKSAEAAKALKITAQDLLELKLIDEIITEPSGGSHNSVEEISANLKKTLLQNLKELMNLKPFELKEKRRDKFRNFGVFEENI
jgi:acetyl-CoA carboxylase carboxyl transferase subunit alpha